MPTPPGFANVSIKLKHTSMTRPAYITFGCNPTPTTGTAVAAAIESAWSGASSAKSIFDNEVYMTAIRVAMGSDGTEDVITEVNYNVQGGIAGASSLPPNCALLVHKRTARGGRRGKGRMFLPWVVQDTLCDDVGVITGASVTTLQTAMTNFFTQCGVNGCPWYLLHRPSDEDVEHPTTPGPPTAITSVLVDPLISSQRRRLGRK